MQHGNVGLGLDTSELPECRVCGIVTPGGDEYVGRSGGLAFTFLARGAGGICSMPMVSY